MAAYAIPRKSEYISGQTYALQRICFKGSENGEHLRATDL